MLLLSKNDNEYGTNRLKDKVGDWFIRDSGRTTVTVVVIIYERKMSQ